jgi:hypothetical protein
MARKTKPVDSEATLKKVVLQNVSAHKWIFPILVDGVIVAEIGIAGLDTAGDKDRKSYDDHESIGNISILDEDIYDLLKEGPEFKMLVDANKIRVLDAVPDGYLNANRIAADARGAADKANAEAAEAKEKLSVADAEIADLKAKLAALGGQL